MNKKLFIGIPCYRESEMLHRTLEFLRRNSTVPNTLEVHIAQQSVVRNKNALLEKVRLSGAEYACLCDDDIEPEPGWDRKLIQGIEEVHARTKRRVGQTGPLMLFPDSRVFSSWMNVYFDDERLCGFVQPVGTNEPCNDLYRVKLYAGALAGTLTVFTRAFLEGINWQFDDRYERSQHEDVDQSLTCRDHGFDLLYNGTVTIIHHMKQANPRAGDENLRKLTDKWVHRPELSLIIPPEESVVRRAEAGLYSRAPSAWGKLLQAFQVVRVNPLHRFGAGFRVLRTRGLRGLAAQFRQKMQEAAINKA